MSDIQKDIIRFKEVFSSPNGKEVLKKILNYCGLLRTSYVQGDSLATARNEGRREVGLEIVRILKMNEDQINHFVDNNFNLEDF